MLKPIIKVNNNNLNVSNWIIEKFPQNYNQMNYLEVFVGNGSVLLNKEKSVEEVVNDLDEKIINIWLSIRDEGKLLKNKISKITYSEKNFNLIKTKKNDKDYLKQSISEICSRKMSKSGQKEIYDLLDRKKSNFLWKEMVSSIPKVSERIQNVYFLNKSPTDLVKSFNNQNTLCFCSPPNTNSNIMKIDDHIDLGDALNSYRGKVLVYAENIPIYRRIFSSWKCVKRKTASGTAKECLWMNF